MRTTKGDRIKFILVAVLLLMGVGYAYLTTNLNINGTANIYDHSYENYNQVTIGQAIPAHIIQYQTAEEAIEAFQTEIEEPDIDRPFCLMHKIQDNIVTHSYVVFIVKEAGRSEGMTPGTYLLEGGVDEETATNKPIYEKNKKTLLKAFGSSNCETYDDGLNCETSILTGTIYTWGAVSASYDYWGAGIDYYKYSYYY